MEMAENEMAAGRRAPANIDTEEAREARRRLFVRMTLVQEFGLDSAFIGVPKLARILGLTPNTIWSYMRQGKFFIPYRRFNTTPVVCIDDLVEWYCGRRDLVLPSPDAATLDDMRACKTIRPPVERDRERAELDASYDDIVANALASMGLDPAAGRGRRPSR